MLQGNKCYEKKKKEGKVIIVKGNAGSKLQF